MLKENSTAVIETAVKILPQLWEAVVYFQSEQCLHSLKRPRRVVDRRVLTNVKMIRTLIRPRPIVAGKEPEYEMHYQIRLKGIGSHSMRWDRVTDPRSIDAQIWVYCLEWMMKWLRDRTITEDVPIQPTIEM